MDRWRAGEDATIDQFIEVIQGPVATVEQWYDYLRETHPDRSEEWASASAQQASAATSPVQDLGLYDRAMEALPSAPPSVHPLFRAWQGLAHEALRTEWKRSKDLALVAEDKKPPFIPLGQTREMETTNEDYVIGNGLLTRGGKMMVYAYAGAGKTTFLDSAAASLASGIPMLGAHAIDRPHRVLYVQGELTTSEIASHGQDLLEHFEGTEAEANLIFWRHTQLPLPQAERALREAIIESEATILILDPFNRFFRGDNSMTQEQVGEVFRMVDRLMEDPDLGLEGSIISHHSNVSRARMAGTYDFEGWPSTILRLEVISPMMPTRKLTFEKIRAPRSSLLGTTAIIELTNAGYVYTAESAPATPHAGPFLVAKALAELGGTALRKDLVNRTMALANVRPRAAQGYVADALTQNLIARDKELAAGKNAVYRLVEQPQGDGEDAA